MEPSNSSEYVGHAQHVVFATGAAADAITAAVRTLAAKRALLVASETGRTLIERLAVDLPIVGVFDRVQRHIPVRIAESARIAAIEADADALLAVGGGSAIGTAKAIALRTGLPIIAVPTTYAGSEATPVWGITEGGTKTTGRDARVLPREVVYDAALVSGLPRDAAGTSGLNAVAHCIDSLWAPRANPVSTALAVEGLRTMAAALPAMIADDAGAGERCLAGAYLSGAAFASAGSGLHHKACHVLGGAYDLPHAATHSILLPHVLAFNAPAAAEARARIATALGVTDPVGGLASLVRALDAPVSLRDIGLLEGELDEAARLVAAAAPSDNPRTVTKTDARALLDAAWRGELPERLEET